MTLKKEYLKKIWDSVWEDGLTELDVQKRYFNKLDKELKGQDRFYLKTLQRQIQGFEMKASLDRLLENSIKPETENENFYEFENPRTQGDGTEWIIERDQDGNLYKRVLGSNRKVFINKKKFKK